ncbi:MAG TPA: hypothetical protein VKT73_08295 [Xanthobacteraceae bacterium]|nr:hypothetical protein [Xanthobacteraceae bacterium]
MTLGELWKRIFAAVLLVAAVSVILEWTVPASGPIIAIAAALGGFATWAAPMLAMTVHWYRDRTGPKPVSLQIVGRNIFIVLLAAFFSVFGLPLAIISLIFGQGTRWAWFGLLAIVALWGLGAILLALIRTKRPG